jgi:hypothetical protein
MEMRKIFDSPLANHFSTVMQISLIDEAFYYTGNNEYPSCHSRESGNPRQNWMPDQVRHDNLSHVYLPE